MPASGEPIGGGRLHGRRLPELRDFWADKLKYIMLHDPLLMIFIDPDGDGRNCIEMHINALDNVDDVWLKEGSTSRKKQVLNLKKDNYHLEWDCPGGGGRTKSVREQAHEGG